MADNVIKQGLLRKAFAADNRLSGLWDKIDPVKWFIFLVRSGTPYLEYYDKENDVFTGDPINSFSLNGCQAITYNLGRNTRNHFCIVLHDRVLELGCPSREVMLDWCRTLERSLKQLGVLNTERGEHIYTQCPAVIFSGRKKEEEAAEESRSQQTASGAQGSETPVQLRRKTDVMARFSVGTTQEDDSDEGEYMDCAFDVWPDSALQRTSRPSLGGEPDVSDTSGDFVDEDFFLKFKKNPRKKAGRQGDAVKEEDNGQLLGAPLSGADSSSPKPVPAPRRLLNTQGQEKTPPRKEDSNNNECTSDCPPQCEIKEEGYLVMHTRASSRQSPAFPAPHCALTQYVSADNEVAGQNEAFSGKALERDRVIVDPSLMPQQSQDVFSKESTSHALDSPFDDDFNPFQGQGGGEERSQASGGGHTTDLSTENPYVPFPVPDSEAPAAPGESLHPSPGPRESPRSASPGAAMAPQRSHQNDGSGSPPPVPLTPVPRMPPVALRQTTQEPACPIPRIPPPLVPRQGSSQTEPHPLPPRQPPPRPPANGALDPGRHPDPEERGRAEQRTTQRKFVSNYSLEDDDSDKTVEEEDSQTNYRAELMMSDLRNDDSSSVPPTLPPRQDSLPNHPISRLSPDFLRVQLPHRDLGASSHRASSPLHLDKGEVGGKASPGTSELHSKNAAADETNPNMLALQSKNWAADETNPNMPPPLPPRPQGMLSPSQDNPPPLPPVRSRTVVDRNSRHQVVSDGEVSSTRAEPRIGSDGYLVQSSRQLSAKMRLDRSNSIHAVVSLKQSQVEILREQKAMPGLMHQLTPTAAANGLALVDMLSAVWVAGWNQREYPSLHGKFHVGDQVLSINKVKVENSVMAAKMLRGSDKVEVVVRRIPYGEVFAIKRSAEGERLGIHREGGTAEILYVDPNGLAATHGLPAKAHMTLGLGNCNWVLTEINSRPLNLFFKEQEIEHRLYAVGKEISIVVQPSDFIFELKKKLKKIKNYKSFLVQ